MKPPFAVMAASLVALSVAGPAFADPPAEASHLVLLAEDLVFVDGPAALPPGAKIAVLEGDPSREGPFTMRLLLPAGYRIPPHLHPTVERLTVLSGTFYLGVGDTLDERAATAMPAGGYFSMPARMHHYAFTREQTMVQLHGIGPWEIIYLDPADDPRQPAGAPR